MADLLELLGFKKRTHVGISLSTNNFVELVCIDKVTKSVTKYVSGNVKYNNAVREIMDYDEFTEVIENLFSEAGLNPSECAVTLNLPNVHFGITQFDATYEGPYIVENLQMEIEDLYIFKRSEPSISYSILSQSSKRNQQIIAYSAMQTNVIGRIIEIFDALQIDIVRIDSSYSALIKALQFTDRFSKYFANEEKTLVVHITQSSCNTFSFLGKKLTEFAEEPIAVKSLSIDEVYSTIAKTSKNAISKGNPQNLIVISETDEVNAETLTSRLGFEGAVDYINKSLNQSDSFIDVTGSNTDIDINMVSYLTIEAVGAAIADYDEFETNINFLPQDRIGSNIIEVNGYEINLIRFIIMLLVSSFVLALIIGMSTKAILNAGIDSVQTEKMSKDNEMNVFQRQIDASNKKTTKNIFPVLQKTIENNTAVLDAYVQLSTEIPENVYIKRFVTSPQGGIGILGEAKSSDLVTVFVNKLREKNPDLIISKLSISSQDSILPNSTNRRSGLLIFEIKTANKDISIEDVVIPEQTEVTQKSNPAPKKRQSGSTNRPPVPLI